LCVVSPPSKRDLTPKQRSKRRVLQLLSSLVFVIRTADDDLDRVDDEAKELDSRPIENRAVFCFPTLSGCAIKLSSSTNQ
jgi:hypothetical protein